MFHSAVVVLVVALGIVAGAPHNYDSNSASLESADSRVRSFEEIDGAFGVAAQERSSGASSASSSSSEEFLREPAIEVEEAPATQSASVEQFDSEDDESRVDESAGSSIMESQEEYGMMVAEQDAEEEQATQERMEDEQPAQASYEDDEDMSQMDAPVDQEQPAEYDESSASMPAEETPLEYRDAADDSDAESGYDYGF